MSGKCECESVSGKSGGESVIGKSEGESVIGKSEGDSVSGKGCSIQQQQQQQQVHTAQPAQQLLPHAYTARRNLCRDLRISLSMLWPMRSGRGVDTVAPPSSSLLRSRTALQPSSTHHAVAYYHTPSRGRGCSILPHAIMGQRL